jgi:hypothetical protein
VRVATIDDVVVIVALATVPHTTRNNTSRSGYMTFQACHASVIPAKRSSRAARRGRAEKADKSSIGPSRISDPRESFLFVQPEVTDSPSSQKPR